MNVPLRILAAAALLAAALPAAAFIRETTSVGSPTQGVCLWWGSRSVTYHVNATAVTHTACQTATAAEAAVAAGFDAWGAASDCTDFAFVHGDARPAKYDVADDGVNLVVFRSGKCGPGQTPSANNCWDAANYGATTTAITTNHFDPTTGQITDADLELFAWDGQTPSLDHGHYFSCGGSGLPSCSGFAGTACNADDVQAVVTHEAGHVLGLDHPCEYPGATPPPAGYPSCSAGSYPQIMNPLVGDLSQRGIKDDDKLGVCTIYPKGGPTLTCGSTKKKSSGGCASGEGAGLVGLAVAALAALRLRRR